MPSFEEQWQEAMKECVFWKASHDNQVHLKRTLMDRPDLKERATLVVKMSQEIEKFKTALQEIATYDEQSIWDDDCDDCRYGMLEIARKALGINT